MSTHNPIISSREIARLIDISAVRADSTRQDVEDIIDGAIKHNFICVFPMPGMLPLVFEKLKDHPQIKTLYLHLDNDAPGREATQHITNLLLNQYQIRDVPPIGCKDVNDFLMKLRSQSRNRMQERQSPPSL